MFWRFCVLIFVGALMETQCVPAEVSKSKEKVRAYEFGFSIEEQQHRHEKRDENGIVMGEFGFITADGIYHVTVYATDENGKFKILAMKNYPYKSPEKRMMIAMLPPIKMPVVVPPIKKAIPTDTKSCGGCILTKKLVPEPVVDVAEEIPGNQLFRPLSKTFNEGPVKKAPVPSVGILKPKGTPLVPPKLPAGALKPSLGVNTKTIGMTPEKITPGGSINGKPVKPGFATPAIDSRVGSINSPTVSNGVQQTQKKPLSVGGIFKPTLHSPTKSSNSAKNKQITPQALKPNINTLTTGTLKTTKQQKSVQTHNENLPTGQGSKVPTRTAQLTKNTIKPKSPSSSAQYNNKNALNKSQITDSITPNRIQQKNTQNIGPSLTQHPTQTINKKSLIKSTGPLLSLTTPQLTQIRQPKLINSVERIQNTNGPAKTPTINSQSTTKLTPIAPSAQSIGKGTPSINGIGAGSNGGGGGGPLYRFNYVLDYNSHREEGAIDGSKKGDYKTIDEDGIRRIIDYIANENGYQPHIKWVRIPANELPTGENKLKEYEFVWFNRP